MEGRQLKIIPLGETLLFTFVMSDGQKIIGIVHFKK